MSKMATDEQKLGGVVAAATRIHTDTVRAALEAVLGPVMGEGEAVPDVGPLHVAMGSYLEHLEGRLVTADNATLAERLEERSPLRQRDEAAAALHARMVEVRAALEGIYGPLGSELLAIDGRTAQDPVVLHRQAGLAVERLRAGDTLPPVLPGLQADPLALAAVLEPPLEQLGQALRALNEERKRTQEALVVKQGLLADYGFNVRWVARLLEALYMVAGLPGLAERVRPAVRRRGRPEAGGEDVPPPDGPEAPSADVAPEEPLPGGVAELT